MEKWGIMDPGKGDIRERERRERNSGSNIIMSQVKKPQCFVVGLEVSGFFSLSLSSEGVSSTVVGQAYFVLQSSRNTPSLKDRKCNSYNKSHPDKDFAGQRNCFSARK